MPRFVLAVLAGFAVLVNAAPASAQEIFCTVVGAKQGTFQGDRTAGKAASQIPFIYQRIELTDLDSNTTAEDNWLAAD